MRKLIIFILLSFSVVYSKENINGEMVDKFLASKNYSGLPVVFVHGIGGNTDHWKYMADIISNKNFFEMRYYKDDKIYHNYISENVNNWVWSVSYYSVEAVEETFNGDLSEYARRLEVIIENIKKITGKDKVILIAHSMGGLVARKYMVNSESNWNTVHRILTVGTPNTGVSTSLRVVGQLKDLGRKSKFIKELDEKWDNKYSDRKWGVVGAIVKEFWIGYKNNKIATDIAGPGYVEISSSIPYNEWKQAVEDMEIPKFYTKNYGFRIAISDNHLGMLKNKGTLKGIIWAMSR